MKLTDAERLDVALIHINILEQHRDRGPLSDDLVFDAVCLRMASAIEEAAKIDNRLLEAEFGATWPKIVATRNSIAHGYRLVDLGVITATVERDLPHFISGLRRIRQTL